MDILKMISEQLNNEENLRKIAEKAGAQPNQVKQAAQLGLPAILQALGKNAANPQGAASLSKALEDHQNDNVLDVSSFLNKVDTKDGAKILQHIFSEKSPAVGSKLANQSGMDTDQAMGVLSQLAPLVLGALGQQKKQENVGATDLSSMLMGLAKNQAGGSNMMSQITNLLDADNDGSIVDDVTGLLGKFMKR
ncbi:MAG: DUF937 domain-containing protein [Eubacteriales bacterium]|jgi:hypothetical protein|nr:DUF937 domain-containing protein [Eubacteriales bacterium]NCC81890.1 DUF937 domain-containing protein [Clostridia bacterium]